MFSCFLHLRGISDLDRPGSSISIPHHEGTDEPQTIAPAIRQASFNATKDYRGRSDRSVNGTRDDHPHVIVIVASAARSAVCVGLLTGNIRPHQEPYWCSPQCVCPDGLSAVFLDRGLLKRLVYLSVAWHLGIHRPSADLACAALLPFADWAPWTARFRLGLVDGDRRDPPIHVASRQSQYDQDRQATGDSEGEESGRDRGVVRGRDRLDGQSD